MNKSNREEIRQLIDRLERIQRNLIRCQYIKRSNKDIVVELQNYIVKVYETKKRVQSLAYDEHLKYKSVGHGFGNKFMKAEEELSKAYRNLWSYEFNRYATSWIEEYKLGNRVKCSFDFSKTISNLRSAISNY